MQDSSPWADWSKTLAAGAFIALISFSPAQASVVVRADVIDNYDGDTTTVDA